jgi:anhydro-N-acetylmuramic acid kinase
MKKKMFTSLGLMSGTSMDGVDISVIKSDGYNEFSSIFDDYYEFDKDLYLELTNLRDKISEFNDLDKYSIELNTLEKKFTLFNAQIVNSITKKNLEKIDLIGFHGQTIFHDTSQKISKQLGDGKLLSQETKCTVVNNFRKNDLKFGGQGAPLTPIFHNLISKIIHSKFKIDYPISIINIGGITNVTQLVNINNNFNSNLYAYDISPGNCLIDQWIRIHSNKRFDQDGSLANAGIVDDLIFNQAVDNFKMNSITNSLDIKDFDLSFVRGLSFENGCATLTKFTAHLIAKGLNNIDKKNNLITKNYLVCGGGRKNNTLIDYINSFIKEKNLKLQNIDKFKFDGDFVESQAFAYLAIRSSLNLPISFPNTTRCEKAISGGVIEKNFKN